MQVLIVKSFVKRFRVPFYEHLIRRLAPMGIRVNLVFGQPDRFHAGDGDIVNELPFAHKTHNKYLYLAGRSLVWQPALRYVAGSDMVIVQQGNRHLFNHVLLPLRESLGFKLAFWGHGRNFQASKTTSLAERAKRIYSRRVDHWFAYTRRSKEVLSELGLPDKRITIVQNSIDTTQMIRQDSEITSDECQALRASLRIQPADPVAIYCARFYKHKDVDFLLTCARELHERNSRFHLLLLGDGADAWKARAFGDAHSEWAHYVGPMYGRDKIKHFRIACCQLMPGAVGLGIVDSFALLTPIITRDIPSHGPEIDYLVNGENGIMTENDSRAYIHAVCHYIEDRSSQRRLVRGCARAREQYTIENMAERFAAGIGQVLSSKSQG